MSGARKLKPTWKRVTLWLILLFGTAFITYLIPFTDVPLVYGFPFPFYDFGGISMTSIYIPPKFDFFYFLIDAIIWYIISAVIIK